MNGPEPAVPRQAPSWPTQHHGGEHYRPDGTLCSYLAFVACGKCGAPAPPEPVPPQAIAAEDLICRWRAEAARWAAWATTAPDHEARSRREYRAEAYEDCADALEAAAPHLAAQGSGEFIGSREQNALHDAYQRGVAAERERIAQLLEVRARDYLNSEAPGRLALLAAARSLGEAGEEDTDQPLDVQLMGHRFDEWPATFPTDDGEHP